MNLLWSFESLESRTLLVRAGLRGQRSLREKNGRGRCLQVPRRLFRQRPESLSGTEGTYSLVFLRPLVLVLVLKKKKKKRSKSRQRRSQVLVGVDPLRLLHLFLLLQAPLLHHLRRQSIGREQRGVW